MGYWFRPLRWLWIAFGVLLVLMGIGAFLTFFFPGALGLVPHRPFFFYGFWPPFFGFGWVFLIFLILIGARWIFWPWRGRGFYYRGYYHDPAMQLLRERYARGEITKEQFDQMFKDLEQSHSRPT